MTSKDFNPDEILSMKAEIERWRTYFFHENTPILKGAEKTLEAFLAIKSSNFMDLSPYEWLEFAQLGHERVKPQEFK